MTPNAFDSHLNLLSKTLRQDALSRLEDQRPNILASFEAQYERERKMLAMGASPFADFDMRDPVTRLMDSFKRSLVGDLAHERTIAMELSAAERLSKQFEPLFDARSTWRDAMMGEQDKLQQILSRVGLADIERTQELAMHSLQATSSFKLTWEREYDNLVSSLHQFVVPSTVDAFSRLMESAGWIAELGEDDEIAQADSKDHQAAAEVLESLVDGSRREPTAVDALAKILEEVQKLKDSKTRLILLSVLFPVLLAIASIFAAPHVDYHVKKGYENARSKQEVTKLIKQDAQEAVGDVRLLDEYRFVKIKKLTLHANPRGRSPSVGELGMAEVVYVVRSEGAFTLVQWRSHDGEAELRGWAHSRYLESFRNRKH